jgi:hypothetical protein
MVTYMDSELCRTSLMTDICLSRSCHVYCSQTWTLSNCVWSRWLLILFRSRGPTNFLCRAVPLATLHQTSDTNYKVAFQLYQLAILSVSAVPCRLVSVVHRFNLQNILSTSWVNTRAFFPFCFKEDFVDAVERSVRVTWIQIFNFQEDLMFET